MPVTISALKKLRQDKKRQGFNLIVKKKVKEAIKNFRRQPSEKLYRTVASLLDQAAKKKIFHKNKSSRLKSNLYKLMKSPKKEVKEVKTKKAAKTPAKKARSPKKT